MEIRTEYKIVQIYKRLQLLISTMHFKMARNENKNHMHALQQNYQNYIYNAYVIYEDELCNTMHIYVYNDAP